MSENAPPPASQRPGELRSALPGLTLLCANALLGALLLGSFVWPGAFGVASRQSAAHQPALAPPTPTNGDLFDISALPTAVSTRTIATTTATAPRPTATLRASHATPIATAIPTPTPTPSVPTPTALPVSSTPSPTFSPGG